MPADGQIVLASGSPRRRQLLERIGLPHRVVVPDVDERRRDGEPVEAYVRRMAREKALAVAAQVSSRDGGQPWVLGADTVVVVDGEPLGKPADEADAASMLAALSDREHTVLTAFSVVRGHDEAHAHLEATRVWFRPLDEAEIDGYVASGEPLDKAGAYGIQGLGCALVARIEGNYENVVGLPVTPLVEALKVLGALRRFPDVEASR